ncbi:MAG: hypothetical protein LE178_02435 [Endomicrobium sp.]|nr:hypothetical protein [Endomicrobium sp.]
MAICGAIYEWHQLHMPATAQEESNKIIDTILNRQGTIVEQEIALERRYGKTENLYSQRPSISQGEIQGETISAEPIPYAEPGVLSLEETVMPPEGDTAPYLQPEIPVPLEVEMKPVKENVPPQIERGAELNMNFVTMPSRLPPLADTPPPEEYFPLVWESQPVESKVSSIKEPLHLIKDIAPSETSYVQAPALPPLESKPSPKSSFPLVNLSLGLALPEAGEKKPLQTDNADTHVVSIRKSIPIKENVPKIKIEAKRNIRKSAGVTAEPLNLSKEFERPGTGEKQKEAQVYDGEVTVVAKRLKTNPLLPPSMRASSPSPSHARDRREKVKDTQRDSNIDDILARLSLAIKSLENRLSAYTVNMNSSDRHLAETNKCLATLSNQESNTG